MAEKKSQQPETVRVKILTNYGIHRPGEWITAPIASYRKYRLLEAQGNSPPVMRSEADLMADQEAAQKAEEERLAVAAAAQRIDHDHADGWLKYRQQSWERVQGERVVAQREMLDKLGTAPPAPAVADQQADFRARMSSARTSERPDPAKAG